MSFVGFVTFIHIVVAFFMILVVLVQGGNSGGVGAAFGGGNSSGFFGATGGNTFFQKLTYGAAIIFMITSVTLTVNTARSGDVGLADKLEQEIKNKDKDAKAQNKAAGDAKDRTESKKTEGENTAPEKGQ